MEAAGLALGSVALAGLFSSCIDVLEYLETSRHWARDVHITLTKLSLMKRRLREWGGAFAIDSVASGQQFRPQASEQEEWLISNSLWGIHGLLDATSRLCIKHACGRGYLSHRRAQDGVDGVYEKDMDSLGSASTLDSLEVMGKVIRQSHRRDDAGKISSGWRTLRSRAVWALVDKGRFNALITELDFLISNLERLGERGRMAPRSSSSSETEDCERTYDPVADRKKGTFRKQKPRNVPEPSQPSILERAMREEIRATNQGILVSLASMRQADGRRGSETMNAEEERPPQAQMHGEKGQGIPSVCRNQAGENARQVNRTEGGGPNVHDNKATGNARMANGVFDNDVAKKVFE